MKNKIIENNKLIAEFMGFQLSWLTIPYGDKKENTVKIKTYVGDFPQMLNEHCQPETLFYHSSWDWLMPVVEKITKDYAYIAYLPTCSEDEWAVEFYSDKKEPFIVFKCVAEEYDTSYLKAVYKAIIEFIKWYNKNR